MIDREKWEALNPWAFWAAFRMHVRALDCLAACYLCQELTARAMFKAGELKERTHAKA